MAGIDRGHRIKRVVDHLRTIASEIGPRPVGSEANRLAVAYARGVLDGTGMEVEEQPFEALAWKDLGSTLTLNSGSKRVMANPFSPPCQVQAEAVLVRTVEELERADVRGKVVVMAGDLSSEQLFPKNYPFFSVPEHQRVVSLLEERAPSAIVCVSSRVESIEPIIEDGDFHIPSVTVPKTLQIENGQPLLLTVSTHSELSWGSNVVASSHSRKGRRIVVCAHIDTKPDTPGALDNASGVATLLLLAELLAESYGGAGVEIALLNGEDYYSSPGQVRYVQELGDSIGEIDLAINVDGVGYAGSLNTVAFFEMSDGLRASVNAVVEKSQGIVSVDPWPQGDHMIFAAAGIASLALTSASSFDLLESLVHTEKDTTEILDPESVVQVSEFIESILKRGTS